MADPATAGPALATLKALPPEQLVPALVVRLERMVHDPSRRVREAVLNPLGWRLRLMVESDRLGFSPLAVGR